jgi:hypothetical protein|tara:strand:+ start:581 stop:1123 length:543 start_codon:yes stop_codon:yes gene_type:complete
MAAFSVIDHTEIGTGGAAEWEVTGIDQSYDHLLLLVSARSERTGVPAESVIFSLNGSTAANYSITMLRILSGSPASTRVSGMNGFSGYQSMPAGDATADTFGIMKIWIPNYANTANYKQVLWQTVAENASTGSNEFRVSLTAGLYSENTDAIDEMKMICYTGSTDIAEFSTFTLYGVSGA